MRSVRVHDPCVDINHEPDNIIWRPIHVGGIRGYGPLFELGVIPFGAKCAVAYLWWWLLHLIKYRSLMFRGAILISQRNKHSNFDDNMCNVSIEPPFIPYIHQI